MAVEEIGGNRREQERPKAEELSAESYLEDGASVPSLRQKGKTARKRDTYRMETENLETGRRKAKD